ncbi:MAG: hypothetical protein R3E79_51950 [Caldilineaceae bacterium]
MLIFRPREGNGCWRLHLHNIFFLVYKGGFLDCRIPTTLSTPFV